MQVVREDRIQTPDYVWMASTLGGNAITCAAANAALGVFRLNDTYSYLHDLGHYFRDGLQQVLSDTGHEGQVVGDGPLGQIIFSSNPIYNYRSSLKADRAKAKAMMMGLFERNVFLNPMGTKLYLSLAHDHGVCDEFLTRLKAVLTDL